MKPELTFHLENTVQRIITEGSDITKISADTAVKLTLLGFIGLDEKGELHLTNKAVKAYTKRIEKARIYRLATAIHKKMIEELLTQPGQLIKIGGVCDAMGRDEYERNDIVLALRLLRDQGHIKNIKMSSNNFQNFWALNKDEATPATFTTNG